MMMPELDEKEKSEDDKGSLRSTKESGVGSNAGRLSRIIAFLTNVCVEKMREEKSRPASGTIPHKRGNMLV